MIAVHSDRPANQAVMRLTLQWRCATCGHAADANPGVCPRCGASAGPPTVADRWNRDHPRDPMLASAGARARRGIRPIARRARSARVGRRRQTRVRAPLLVLSAAAAILLAATLWITGMFTSGSSSASRRTSAPVNSRPVSHPRVATRTTDRKPRPRVATPRLGAHRVFAGRAFSVAYPQGWTITAAETPAPWGTDTTISAPGDQDTMLRVDVTTNPATSDPITAAEPVIAGVARQPGYRVLGLTTGTFDGRRAARWEFLVEESGKLLRKVDVFFTSPSGSGIAVLTSAPAGAYENLAGRFTAIRRSLAAH
jgi:hypothetical protein